MICSLPVSVAWVHCCFSVWSLGLIASKGTCGLIRLGKCYSYVPLRYQLYKTDMLLFNRHTYWWFLGCTTCDRSGFIFWDTQHGTTTVSLWSIYTVSFWPLVGKWKTRWQKSWSLFFIEKFHFPLEGIYRWHRNISICDWKVHRKPLKIAVTNITSTNSSFHPKYM